MSMTASDIFEDVSTSLVKIRAYKGSQVLHDSSGLVREDFEHGTGFTVENSLVVTAKHTVEFNGILSRSIQCWSNERGRYEGCTVVYTSPTSDIAILWYPGMAKPHLKLRNIDTASANPVTMAGYPDLPYARPRLILTRGTITKWSTSAPGATHVQERKNLAVSDVLSYPGCSGAPTFGPDNAVVGMVVSAMENAEGEWTGETYLVHATDIAAALAVARKSIEKKKGYEFLGAH
jgi:V8-like Glu-specific endopeptidase